MLRHSCRAWSSFLLLLACGSPVTNGETDAASTSSAGTTAATTIESTSEATTGATGSTTAETTGAATTASPTTTGPTTSESEGEPDNLWLAGRFLNIAHRGGAALRPEETLPAFAHALAVGADVIEFDVHASADGVLVAIHDDTVDRTTDGAGAVSAMTLAELQALDAGYRFTADDGQTFPYRGMGIMIPTVEEILGAFPDSYYLIEIKQTEPPIVDALLSLLGEHGARGRALLASFDSEPLIAARAAAPDVLTSMSTTEMLDFYTNMDNPDYMPPASFAQPPWELTTSELVAHAHGLGVAVQPWTVNTGKSMTELVALGVDGIMTDDPELLAGLAPP